MVFDHMGWARIIPNSSILRWLNLNKIWELLLHPQPEERKPAALLFFGKLDALFDFCIRLSSPCMLFLKARMISASPSHPAKRVSLLARGQTNLFTEKEPSDLSWIYVTVNIQKKRKTIERAFSATLSSNVFSQSRLASNQRLMNQIGNLVTLQVGENKNWIKSGEENT